MGFREKEEPPEGWKVKGRERRMVMGGQGGDERERRHSCGLERYGIWEGEW